MAPGRFSTESGVAARDFGCTHSHPSLMGYREPITVELSPPAGSLGVGPHDDRMCVIAPLGKTDLLRRAVAA